MVERTALGTRPNGPRYRIEKRRQSVQIVAQV
jgi:hypothetical protein